MDTITTVLLLIDFFLFLAIVLTHLGIGDLSITEAFKEIFGRVFKRKEERTITFKTWRGPAGAHMEEEIKRFREMFDREVMRTSGISFGDWSFGLADLSKRCDNEEAKKLEEELKKLPELKYKEDNNGT